MRIALLFVCACSAPSVPVAVPVLPDVPFALLDRDQRATFMEQRVVPRMAPLFRTHDPKRYATFGCKTCHGDSRDFTMPNPRLPLISERSDPRAVEWMMDTIQPAMSELIDHPFECTRCHVREPR
jgi:hypothetical protein